MTFRALALRQSKKVFLPFKGKFRPFEAFLPAEGHRVEHTHINFQLIQLIVLLVTPTQSNTSSYRD